MSAGMLMNLVPQAALDLGNLISGADNMLFFAVIFEFIRDEISEFETNTLREMYKFMAGATATLVTLWISFKGYMIATGRSKESLMELAANSARTVFILGAAAAMGMGPGGWLYDLLANDVPDAISQTITGSNASTMARKLDVNLVLMQAALSSVDQMIQVTGDNAAQTQQAGRAKMMLGAGIAGPAITGGALLLLNKVAIALFVGFGPLFIMCLLFDQTKQLFSKWLFYGVGTFFSMAVLSAMVSISLKVILGVVGAMWLREMLPGIGGVGDMQSVSSMALQQGGLGLVLTVLIVSAPPMAASFFQGVLGQFSSYNQMAQQGGGGGGRTDPSGRPLGGNVPQQAGNDGAAGGQKNIGDDIGVQSQKYANGSTPVIHKDASRDSSNSQMGAAVNPGRYTP